MKKIGLLVGVLLLTACNMNENDVAYEVKKELKKDYENIQVEQYELAEVTKEDGEYVVTGEATIIDEHLTSDIVYNAVVIVEDNQIKDIDYTFQGGN